MRPGDAFPLASFPGQYPKGTKRSRERQKGGALGRGNALAQVAFHLVFSQAAKKDATLVRKARWKEEAERDQEAAVAKAE